MNKYPGTGSTGKILIIFFVAIILFLSSCEKAQTPQDIAAVPVTVVVSVLKNVPVQLRAIGNVEAYSTVSVRSQIGGVLVHVHFKEGQNTEKGDLLFTIDPRPYEAALKQAEATLARDTAQLENAREQARRYEELVKKGYVTQEQYEQVRTNAVALEATVSADRAVVENARLNLKYCYIYSPISGRTGNLNVNEGNLIKANADSSMVVINQVQPVYVTFSVPEQNLTDIRRHMSGGKLNIDAYASREDRNPLQGVLTFIDNTVDISTGTIKLKGQFGNKEKRLWPGQFVDIKITLTNLLNAVVVPSGAVQTGQQGQYLYVVSGETAELRQVTAGSEYEGMTVILKGLQAGETVVTDGQLRLMPGARVEVRKTGQQGPAVQPSVQEKSRKQGQR